MKSAPYFKIGRIISQYAAPCIFPKRKKLPAP